MADVIDPDVEEVPAAPTALELRRPDVPMTLDHLALLKEQGTAILEVRIRNLETARQASIRATHPQDWLLFRSLDDLVVGYLQDSGCERVRDIFGISIFNVSTPEKVPGAVPGEFHYLVRGDGTCHMTAQTIEGIEGGRSSTEDFCKDKSGAALELAVRKAARANLDGQIVRELAGLGQVPLAQLDAAWSGTHKTSDHCRRGRGFGSRIERLGQRVRAEGETREAPVCRTCGSAMKFQPAGKTDKGKSYDAFWSCPKRQEKHRDENTNLDDAKWREQLKPSAPVSVTPAPVAGAAPSKVEGEQKPPLTADDVFGREPGSEG